MTTNNLPRNHALLFANGPYQLLIGVASVRKHCPENCEIMVIPYDMKWQKELSRVTCKFAEFLGLKVIHLPFEFLKSSADNKKTYIMRSSLNHILFFLYTKKYCKQYAFLPKLYGAPERAILLAASKKKVIIYDDGYGQYVNPKVHISKFDEFVYRIIGLDDPIQNNISIAPRNPSLINFNSSQVFTVLQEGYTQEFKDVMSEIAGQREFLLSLKIDEENKPLSIFITLPRFSFAVKDVLISSLSKLISQFFEISPEVKFLLKPHPRDINVDFTELTNGIHMASNWRLLPLEMWCYPAEVICLALNPVVVLTGTSTVAINSDLLPQTKVMIYDFLSFNIPGYNEKSKEIMVKSGNFTGCTAEDAINILGPFIKSFLRNQS
jgi:hypothetical protein